MQEKSIYKKSYIIPALLIYGILFVVPVIMGFAYSMTNWNSMNDKVKFIGLHNFETIFLSNNGEYLKYIWNTLWFAIITSLFEAIIGIGLALLLNGELKTKSLLRSVFFLPQTISALIIGLMFTSIFARSGIINSFLTSIGLGFLTHDWLVDVSLAMPSVMFVEIWRYAGLNMVIFLAGLQMIPKEYYEAGEIDGASLWKQFTNITIPYIMPSITINTVLNMIHGLKVFDVVFVLTNGGPGNITEVLNTSVFREYAAGNYGLSSAEGLILFLITTAVALSVQAVISRKEVEI